MCIATVYIENGEKGEREEVMHDVIFVEAERDGFRLTGLLGDEKFIAGELKSIDFFKEHSVVIRTCDR